MKSVLFVVCLACLVSGIGCSGSQPPLDSNQEKQASQLDDLAKKSGGDWTKLSPDEQKAAIQIGGSEQGAKMLLLSKSGKLGHKGGPGAPGGPPAGASTGQ